QVPFGHADPEGGEHREDAEDQERDQRGQEEQRDESRLLPSAITDHGARLPPSTPRPSERRTAGTGRDDPAPPQAPPRRTGSTARGPQHPAPSSRPSRLRSRPARRADPEGARRGTLART